MAGPHRQRPESMAALSLPGQIEPMLAQAVTEPFDSADHLFEIKWDGMRCIAFVEPDRLRLQSRRNIEMRDRFPELSGLRGLPGGTVLDGEIVVLHQGKPSFAKLQQRMHLLDPRRIELLSRRLPATLMPFDLLYRKGQNVMAEPLQVRRERLRDVVGRLGDPHVLVPDFIVEHGRQYFAAVESHDLEGVMAKRLSSPYLPGKSSPHWLKIKVAQTTEFDIIGYVPREGAAAISALAIGIKSRGRWIYKGKVGSGFTELMRAQFYEALSRAPKLEHPPGAGPGGVAWRTTGLTCRVRFFEQTISGKPRAPVFKGLVESR